MLLERKCSIDRVRLDRENLLRIVSCPTDPQISAPTSKLGVDVYKDIFVTQINKYLLAKSEQVISEVYRW